MKKIVLWAVLFGAGMVSAQFKVNIEAPDSFAKNQVIIYELGGSKDFITAQASKKNGKWQVNIPKNYMGRMKAYFPENNKSVSFISENKDVEMKLKIDAENNISGVDFLDKSNAKMDKVMHLQQRQTRVLPALQQIKAFYEEGSDFGKALAKEIALLQNEETIGAGHPFIAYYLENSKYALQDANPPLTTDNFIDFLANSGEMLETSSLMRPALINFLRSTTPTTVNKEVDKLLERVDVKTSRGQTILSELLAIFDAYGLEEQKEKYYQQASNLTCSINRNLAGSIKSIKNTSIGAVMPDYTFTANVTNAKAKKLSAVKADKKVVLFWASTCPHCLSELPIILENYKKLKQKNIEVVAFALDTDMKLYKEKTAPLPWINDTELKGWQSSYAETYNVHATPTYYVLDKNNKIIEKPANFSAFLSTLE